MGDKLRIDYGDEYEPTDSENDYSDGEKEVLQEVPKGRGRREQDSKQEVMAFDDSDDAEEDDDDVGMGDSDIEGAEDDTHMPDSKDWGNKSRNYYNTDFVDPDFSSYTAEQEEMAKQEEEEAKIIQLRLIKEMNEEDFLLDEPELKVTADEDSNDAGTMLEESTKLKADFSGLSKRERQQLFQKDSPEFPGLIRDFEEYLHESQSLLNPVLQYVRKHKVPMIPALEFAQLYQNIVLTYCSNVAFYLLLKTRRVSIRNHPITKRFVQLKQLLRQLNDKYENIIRPQLEALLERIADGDDFEVLPIEPKTATKTNKKSKLSILDQYGEDKRSTATDEVDDEDDTDSGSFANDEIGGEEVEGTEATEEDTRRGINYQIAKNKGLTPHRKKELRNPRVKHRSKFRKALIRRKGAVRTVRKENKRYGGEVSGIKASVSKSIKFKS